MPNGPANKTTTARAVGSPTKADAGGLRAAYSNCFTARLNPEEAVLTFGFDERAGTPSKEPRRIQVLHKVVLHPATARRLKDTLVALFRKRDASRVRVATQASPPAKNN
jgi:hypothetical protein